MAKVHTAVSLDSELKEKARELRLNMSLLLEEAIKIEIIKQTDPTEALAKAEEVKAKAKDQAANASRDIMIDNIIRAGIPLDPYMIKLMNSIMLKYPDLKLTLDELVELAKVKLGMQSLEVKPFYDITLEGLKP